MENTYLKKRKILIKKYFSKKEDSDFSLFLLRPIAYYLALILNYLKITPNIATLISSLLFIPIFYILLSFSATKTILIFKWKIIIIIFMFASLIFDISDGILARLTKKSSDFGCLFDAFSDRIKESILLILFSYYYYTVHNSSLMFILLLIYFYIVYLLHYLEKYLSNYLNITSSNKSGSSSSSFIKNNFLKYTEEYHYFLIFVLLIFDVIFLILPLIIFIELLFFALNHSRKKGN
jgi:phosphatidylglycerophosphate synthase